jgi:hypothetical protein
MQGFEAGDATQTNKQHRFEAGMAFLHASDISKSMATDDGVATTCSPLVFTLQKAHTNLAIAAEVLGRRWPNQAGEQSIAPNPCSRRLNWIDDAWAAQAGRGPTLDRERPDPPRLAITDRQQGAGQ